MAIRRSDKRPARHSRKRAGGRSKTPAPNRRGFFLKAIDGPNQGKEYVFETQASLGRTDDNEILVVEPGVSRRHARIYEEHGAYLLEDLRSANGTQLNGEKVSAPEVLRDGDYISLSQTSFRFSILEPPQGEPTAQSQLTEEDLATIDRTRTLESRIPLTTLLWGSRRRKLLLASVVLVVMGLGAYRFFLPEGTKTVFDQSETPVTYSDNDAFFSQVFGYGEYDQAHKNRLRVHFEYLGGRATVQYGAWGVDKVGEVSVMLNGKKVGTVPLTMRRWRYGLRLVLPKALLKEGSTNELSFDNIKNPPGEDPWEVCYVQIIQEAIPPANPAEARYQFAMAKKTWENSELEPRNASRALLGFMRSRDLLEALEKKPDLYQESLDFIQRIDKELTRRFQEALFSARRAQRVDKDVRKSRRVLERSLRFFRKGDFRYRELQRYLDALSN